MTDQLTVLQLVLDHLQMDNDVSTIDDRIALQKTVCLAQEAGLQMGYSFNWHVRGPYSSALSNDYYQLAAPSNPVEKYVKRYELTSTARTALEKVKKAIEPPKNVSLGRVHWLELLASIAFLMRRYQMSKAEAQEKIRVSKPALYPYFAKAYAKLKTVGLVE